MAIYVAIPVTCGPEGGGVGTEGEEVKDNLGLSLLSKKELVYFVPTDLNISVIRMSNVNQ